MSCPPIATSPAPRSNWWTSIIASMRLKEALAGRRAMTTTFVLIDCPPSLSLLTLNGLCAAHGVVIPMQCEYYALEGLSDLVNTIKKVHASFNRELKTDRAVARDVRSAQRRSRTRFRHSWKQHFCDKVFRTLVPRNVSLAEAPSYGLPGVLFDRNAAKGSLAYGAFAVEMIERARRF
jgi:chromosome partitioning protein